MAVAESCSKSLSLRPSINSSTFKAASNVSLLFPPGLSSPLLAALAASPQTDPSNRKAFDGSWRIASYIFLYFSMVARSASNARFSVINAAKSVVICSSDAFNSALAFDSALKEEGLVLEPLSEED